MSHESKYSTDHKEIKRWVESRGGRPATIADTGRKGDEVGLLRIDMPGGASNPPLKPIPWDDFFEKFDKEGLVFLYQDETEAGEQSHFCKFVSKETAESNAK
jgi:hypothetical protein